MQKILALLLLGLSLPVCANAGEITYHVNGSVDVSAWSQRDRDALGLGQDDIVSITFEMTVDDRTPDTDSNPDRGAFEAETVRFSFGGIRLQEPQRNLGAILLAPGRNRVLRIYDQVNDTIQWSYVPRSNWFFGHLRAAYVGFVVNSSVLSAPTLEETIGRTRDLQSGFQSSWVILETQKSGQIAALIEAPTISVIYRP